MFHRSISGWMHCGTREHPPKENFSNFAWRVLCLLRIREWRKELVQVIWGWLQSHSRLCNWGMGISSDTDPQGLFVSSRAQSSSDFHCHLWRGMEGSWEEGEGVGKELVNSQDNPPWYPLGSPAPADPLQSCHSWMLVAQTGLQMIPLGQTHCSQSC